jgi:hypothetical protein
MTHLPFIDATFRFAGIRHSRLAIDEKSDKPAMEGSPFQKECAPRRVLHPATAFPFIPFKSLGRRLSR